MHPLYMCSIHLARVTDPDPGIWSEQDLVSRTRGKKVQSRCDPSDTFFLLSVGYGLLDCGIHFVC